MPRQHGSEYEEQVRALLSTIRQGDRAAFDTLIDAIGHEMRKLSAFFLQNRPAAKTLQTTMLVNEAVIRLIQMLDREARKFPATKEHLMALLCQMMRFTLTDYARKKRPDVVSLDEPLRGENGDGDTAGVDMLRDWSQQDIDTLLLVNQALATIEESDPEYGKRRREALELYLFSGMKFIEIAEQLGVSDDIARRDCHTGLAQMRQVLRAEAPRPADVS